MAGTVTNKRVITRNEQSKWGDYISKCPFALLRRKYSPGDVCLIVRDPRNVVTSDTHKQYQGYVIGWDGGQGGARKGLRRHWEALQPYLGESFLVRYEDLVDQPDKVQVELCRHFGLEYSRAFSDWPEGFDVPEYWLRKGLGPQTPFRAPRDWRDNPRHIDRVREQEEHEGFKECCRALGYV